MAEYSRLAKGHAAVLASGGCAPINLPFVPDYVEFINYGAMDTPTATYITKGYWDVNMGQGFAAYDFYDAGPVYSSNVTSTYGISTFEAGLLLQYGPTIQISGITKANPAVVTTASAHGLVSGDVVILTGLYQSSTTGMPQIAGIPFTVTVTSTTAFTIPWNTNQSEYTALSASPTGALMKKVKYPYLYEPGVSVISNITSTTTTSSLGTFQTTTVDTTDAHNFYLGQEVAFRIPNSWGPFELNSLPNTVIPGSPIYGYVIAVTDYNTVVVNIDSSGYTAFTSNQTFAGTPGRTFAQIVAVGDVNTGGVQISAGSELYPPLYTVPIGTTRVNTINGPGIQGAFFNNTSQGFLIGPNLAVAAQSGQTIYWRAYLHDYSH